MGILLVNNCYCSCAHGQDLFCVQLKGGEAYGSVQCKMTMTTARAIVRIHQCMAKGSFLFNLMFVLHSALRGLFPGYPVFHLLGKNQNIICLILLSLQLALEIHAHSKITLRLKESDLFIMHLTRKQPSLWNYLVSIQVGPFCLSSHFSRIIHTDRRRQQGLLSIRAMAANS